MTCREKLEKINPGCKVHDIIDEVCPSDLGYLPDPDWCNCDCELCWDREIPETEDLCSNCVNLGLACNADDGNKVCPHVSHPFSEKITECAYCELVKNESKTVGSYTTHTGDIDKCFDCAHATILVPEVKTAGNEKFCHTFDKKIIGNVIQCTNYVPDNNEEFLEGLKELVDEIVNEDKTETIPVYVDISASGKMEPPTITIKDSGARREFATGAVRDIQEGKGRCDLLPLDVVACFLGSPGLDDCALYSIRKFTTSNDICYLYNVLDNISLHWDDKKTKESYDQIVKQRRCSMILEVSKHFEDGAKKYGEYNWQKGIPTHCYIDSAVRHYLKYLRGDKDEPHDRAFVWNILCCIWTCIHKPELNDYPRKEEKES